MTGSIGYTIGELVLVLCAGAVVGACSMIVVHYGRREWRRLRDRRLRRKQLRLLRESVDEAFSTRRNLIVLPDRVDHA